MKLYLKYKNLKGTKRVIEDENYNEKYFIEGNFWGNLWCIFDKNGNELVRIKGSKIYIGDSLVANVRRKFNLLTYKFDIDSLGWKVGSDHWGREFKIFDANGETIAHIGTNAFKMKPYYELYFLDSKNELMLISIMLIITHWVTSANAAAAGAWCSIFISNLNNKNN